MSVEKKVESSASSRSLPNRYWFTVAPGPAVAIISAGLAFSLYGLTAAPGLTWAYHGADAGDLLAAAVTNGVPHPPGYPLYILLLQGWLMLWGRLAPAVDLAWKGNLFSALWGAICVGVTAHLAHRIAPGRSDLRVLQAAVVALAWLTAPLFWGQALITEVYTLHATIFALLAWVLFAYRPADGRRKAVALGFVTGLGVAHHATIVLLLPAVVYWLWTDPARTGRSLRFWLLYALGVLPGLLLYLRIPLAAGALPPSPVNWGYVTSPDRLWWLISGAAYRRYLFAADWALTGARVSNWALILSNQYTPVGFGVAMAGLYAFDQNHPRMRNVSLLWIAPISLYSISYNTRDSEIYLLPVIWMVTLWLPEGLRLFAHWIDEQRTAWRSTERWLLLASIATLLVLTAVRLPVYSLRGDDEAITYLAELGEVLEPQSLVVSSGDVETFTLWYGVYATGELLERAPGLVLVNVALLQFDWYRDLLVDRYPDLPGVQSGSLPQILAENSGQRPIYFAEVLAPARQDQLVPAGPLWRYQPER